MLPQALWVLEIALLISDAPALLSELQRIGNYNSLSSIGSHFGFFSSPLDYYIEMGRHILDFYDQVEYFNEELITIAIKVLQTICYLFTSFTAQPKSAASISAVFTAQNRRLYSTVLSDQEVTLLY